MGQLRLKGGAVHKLKTWPPFYQDISDGVKTFELRKDDRGFEIGDILFLMEFDPYKNGGCYSGRVTSRLVIYKLDAASFSGIEKGFCILGLGVLPCFLEEEFVSRTQQRVTAESRWEITPDCLLCGDWIRCPETVGSIGCKSRFKPE